MAGLLRRLGMEREFGQVPMATAECMCGWKSARCTSRTKAVALHRQHVADDCPIGAR